MGIFIFLKSLCGAFRMVFMRILKIIVSMKRCYVAVLGYIEKRINFAGVLFKSFFFESAYAKKLRPFCLINTFNTHTKV